MRQITRLDKAADDLLQTDSMVAAGDHFNLLHLFVSVYIRLTKHTQAGTKNENS